MVYSFHHITSPQKKALSTTRIVYSRVVAVWAYKDSSVAECEASWDELK